MAKVYQRTILEYTSKWFEHQLATFLSVGWRVAHLNMHTSQRISDENANGVYFAVIEKELDE